MRVLLSGYYGFGNHGDEALLAGLIRGLQERGHEPLVLSADPPATRRLHGVEAFARTAGLVPALAAADALVSGGGGLLQDRTSFRSLAYYLGVIRLARAFGRATVVYGQSVGPLTERGRRWARRALRGVPVAVRDRPSRDLLAGLGIASTLTADAALLLEPEHGAEVPAAEAATVVLVPRAGFPEHTDVLVEIAKRFADAGAEVVTMGLHPSQDAGAAAAVQAGFTHAPPVYPIDFREAIRYASRARVVVSTRLHALVFAAAAGVPHVGLVYDPKVSGFLDESGGAAFSPPFDVAALYRAASEPAPVDAARRHALSARAGAGMDWLDRQLRAHT